MDESIGFGLYQSLRNRESIGRLSVFGLRWCRWEVDRGFDQGLKGWGVIMSV